jgi:hypothetical protein
MKKLYVVTALVGAVSSVLILGFSRMSMELDKRIPISITICAGLVLLVLAVFGRRIGQAGSIVFALVGIFLTSIAVFVVNHDWQTRSQVERIMKDLQQLPSSERNPP